MKNSIFKNYFRLFAPVLLFAAFSANYGFLFYTFCIWTGNIVPYLVSLLPLAAISCLTTRLLIRAKPEPAGKTETRLIPLLSAAFHVGVLTAGVAGVLSIFYDKQLSILVAIACGYVYLLAQLGVLLFRMRKRYEKILLAAAILLLVTILAQTILTFALFYFRDFLFG